MMIKWRKRAREKKKSPEWKPAKIILSDENDIQLGNWGVSDTKRRFHPNGTN